MDKLFTLSLGVKRDPAVEAWLSRQSGELGEMARKWYSRIRASGFDVLEMMHDGWPTACVRDVPFAYVNVAKAHVTIGFFLGADLADPARLLAGTGKRMRHVKLKVGKEIDSKALGNLIQASYNEVKEALNRRAAEG
jgi:hypothetical protein